MLRRQSWRAAYYLLLAAFITTAALNMLQVHGGFLTNHAADLVVPAWLYIATRGLHEARPRPTQIRRLIGRTPEIAALSLFIASALTELSQMQWPNGLFRGRFDGFDILAYGAGLAVCYMADKMWPENVKLR